MKDFSIKGLNYALENGITKSEPEVNYKQLITNYYEFENHVLIQNELQDYMFDYVTG